MKNVEGLSIERQALEFRIRLLEDSVFRIQVMLIASKVIINLMVILINTDNSLIAMLLVDSINISILALLIISEVCSNCFNIECLRLAIAMCVASVCRCGINYYIVNNAEYIANIPDQLSTSFVIAMAILGLITLAEAAILCIEWTQIRRVIENTNVTITNATGDFLYTVDNAKEYVTVDSKKGIIKVIEIKLLLVSMFIESVLPNSQEILFKPQVKEYDTSMYNLKINRQ